jgi:hypothetical protein
LIDFALLGVELSVMCSNLSHSSSPFASVIFEIKFQFIPKLAWTVMLLSVLPCVAGMTGICHCDLPLVEMGSRELFVQVDLK